MRLPVLDLAAADLAALDLIAPDLARPELWPALLLAPALYALLSWRAAVRRAELRRLLGARSEVLAPARTRARSRAARLVPVLATGLAALALLQPRWGTREGTDVQRGVDVLVCLDVSRSMLARDLAPDRLGFAREALKRLAASERGDRLGLVVFAGEARTSVPLTHDLHLYAELADLADPFSVRKGGTDLGVALEAALEAFEGRTGDHEVAIVLTDGEDLAGRALEVAGRLRERGVALHGVALGARTGARIPVQVDGEERFLRGPDGQPVLSVPDVAGLRAVCERTGGTCVEADDPDVLVRLVDEAVRPLVRRASEGDGRPQPIERYAWPLGLAWALVAVGLWRRRDRRAGGDVA